MKKSVGIFVKELITVWHLK